LEEHWRRTRSRTLRRQGYLKLEFDRIGFAIRMFRFRAKFIAARDTKVNRHGDIVGRGHADARRRGMAHTSTVAWKVLMLPAAVRVPR